MRRIFSTAMAIHLVAISAFAGAELVLEDGQVLSGKSVERKKDLYFLELSTENVLPVPAELVRELRLTGEDDPAPTGLRPAEAETLVGPPGKIEFPNTAEQLAVLDQGRSRFQAGWLDPVWRPSSDWTFDPSMNNFNPARWYQAPIDPTWTPSSAFGASGDVTDFNPARWIEAPIDSTWWPTDGFRKPTP